MASLVWFEIPADNIERAKSFYSALFGWTVEEFPGSPEPYLSIKNRGANNGGMRGLNPPRAHACMRRS